MVSKVNYPNSVHCSILSHTLDPILSRKTSKSIQKKFKLVKDFDKISALMSKWVTSQSFIGEYLSAIRYTKRRLWFVYGKFVTPFYRQFCKVTTPKMEHHLKSHTGYSCLKCTPAIHESLWLLLGTPIFSTLKIHSLFVWCPKNVF